MGRLFRVPQPYTIHALSIHYLYTIYTLSIHYLYTIYTLWPALTHPKITIQVIK